MGLISIRQAAERLGVSQMTIRNRIRDGHIKARLFDDWFYIIDEKSIEGFTLLPRGRKPVRKPRTRKEASRTA